MLRNFVVIAMLAAAVAAAPAWADQPRAARICMETGAAYPTRFTLDWRPAGARDVALPAAAWLRDSQYTFISGTIFCVRPPKSTELRITAEGHNGAGWATACWQIFEAERSADLVTEGDAMEQRCAVR